MRIINDHTLLLPTDFFIVWEIHYKLSLPLSQLSQIGRVTNHLRQWYQRIHALPLLINIIQWLIAWIIITIRELSLNVLNPNDLPTPLPRYILQNLPCRIVRKRNLHLHERFQQYRLTLLNQLLDQLGGTHLKN